METTGFDFEFDLNVRAYLSINLEEKITLERGIKAIGHKEKPAFTF